MIAMTYSHMEPMAMNNIQTRRTEPTEDDIQKARNFASWQTSARNRKGWDVKHLVSATGYSPTQIRLHDNEGYRGIDTNGRYRRPKREYVRAIADATGASYMAGLIASGLVEQKEGLIIAAGLTFNVVTSEGQERQIKITDDDIDYLLFKAERQKERNEI